MRFVIVAMLGLIAGLVAGLVLSEIIGIIGYLTFDRVAGVKFLPLVLGAVCASARSERQRAPQSRAESRLSAVVAPLVDRRIRAGGAK